jgi:hypothetical protein
MGIVSIGEVVGTVLGGASVPAAPAAEQPGAGAAAVTQGTPSADDLERELRLRTRRRTRLHAD